MISIKKKILIPINFQTCDPGHQIENTIHKKNKKLHS
jgi:hypothetical protein